MKKNLIRLSLLFFVAAGTLSSCVEDFPTTTDASRYTASDIQSYADLFKVFWNVMEQRYNYFYEQKRQDGKDWNTIYKEYYPKFEALKTYRSASQAPVLVKEDYEKAKQYFTEIINPIIDRHFIVGIAMPITAQDYDTFHGGMNNPAPSYYDFNDKYGYMKDRLDHKLSNSYPIKDEEPLTYLAGNLKVNPDIYYFTYNQFTLSSTVKLSLADKYLSPDPGNGLLLSVTDIDTSANLNAIKDISVRKKLRDFTVNILNQWNTFLGSPDIKTFNQQVKTFNETEVMSDSLITLAQKLLNQSKNLVNYNDASTYASVWSNETIPYILWFAQQMDIQIESGYQLSQFQNATQKITTNGSLYKSFFNPLHKGDIKKLIIDLRGNGGGAIVDTRFFVDRFITRKTTAFYQRTKEGTGLYNYTPWVPVQTQLHPFGIPNNIPIVILTDKGSASMSEMSTLMLKSQGSQVISIGDYSIGATAGLDPNPNDFNGGAYFQDVAGGLLRFKMPTMASKDLNGNVIEGIGIKPDIYVTPPTQAEIQQMKYSPATFADRVMQEAVKYLSSK